MNKFLRCLTESSGLSCLMAMIPQAYHDYFKRLQDSIDSSDAFSGSIGTPTTANKGLETDYHITIFYGIHTTSSKEVFSLLSNEYSFEITLGEIASFSNQDYDVLKIDVVSSDLNRLNRFIRSNLETTSSFPVYHPHLTLAYLRKGAAKKYHSDITNRVRIPISELCFSTPELKKTKLKLR